MAEQIKHIAYKYPFPGSLFLVFSLVLTLNSLNPRDFRSQFSIMKSDPNIGGEVTEIVSAPEQPKEASILQSVLGSFSANARADSGIYEDSEFNNPLMTGEDSLLQNQNPITIPAPEQLAPPKPISPYYTAGPYLDGYFIFPTAGFNRGKLHAYNAVDISRGDDCLYENIPVFAAASGIVSATYPTESTTRYANGGYGNNLSILHPNGVLTRYAHLKSILVSAGQYVGQGSIIAFMGGYPRNSGSGNSTGCHLHFEVRGAKNPFVR